MGAVIGAGLGSLFILMGLGALAAVINSLPGTKAPKAPSINTDKIDDYQNPAWEAVNPGNLVNENGKVDNFELEQILIDRQQKEATIPEEYQGIDWNSRPTTVQPDFENDISSEIIEENPYKVINPGENAGEEVGFPNSGLYEDGTSVVNPGENAGNGTSDIVINPGENAGNGTSDIVINPGENAGKEIGFPNSGLYEDGTSVVNPNQGQSDEKPPIIENEVKDETGKNEEFTIQGNDLQTILDMINKDFQEQRAYEEKIRKEVQEREDSAYQRATADLRKAGINPNLVNLVQSASGGGIVQPSKKDYSLWQTEISKNIALLEQQIELNFKGEEADKNRLIQTITSVIGLVALGARMK